MEQNSTVVAAKRFKKIREENGHTQASFAQLLGIKQSTADIERGRTKISGKVAALLLKEFGINPLWIFGYSYHKLQQASGPNVSPKITTVDSIQNENMVLVNAKASAGYLHNIQDQEWYGTLPAFSIPLPEYQNATFRGFQVEGDSMIPYLEPTDWVFAKAINGMNEVKSHTVYVIVLVDSVLVKEVFVNMEMKQLKLVSYNTIYPEIVVNYKDVMEIWEVKSRLSTLIGAPVSERKMDSLQQSLARLQEEMKQLRK